MTSKKLREKSQERVLASVPEKYSLANGGDCDRPADGLVSSPEGTSAQRISFGEGGGRDLAKENVLCDPRSDERRAVDPKRVEGGRSRSSPLSQPKCATGRLKTVRNGGARREGGTPSTRFGQVHLIRSWSLRAEAAE